MRRTKLTLFTNAAIMVFLLLSFMQANAQPTNYCNPCANPGWTDFCGTWAAAWITNVVLEDEDGEVSISRNSGLNFNYEFTEVEGAVTLGTNYKVTVNGRQNWTWNSWFSLRVYIDWNQDGDFFDHGEYIGYKREIFGQTFAFSMEFQVPIEAEPGKTRMRVTASRNTSDYGPCFIGWCWTWGQMHWGDDGECEDYVLDIQAGVKDTYPSKDDILYANEVYDGTRRVKFGQEVDFQKPTVYLYSNQKSGTKVNYYISGPLPSTKKVYEALDPRNGSVDVEVGNKGDTYTIEAARGTCADGTTGNFLSDRGGTYKIYAFLHGSPKPKIQTFSVAWDDDLSVNGIVSPKTNVAPKYMKYLRGQTMRITGLFANTGLNDVTEFDAFARIWNGDGDLIYFDSVRYEAPPSQVLKTGDKTEISFRNLRLNDVGIYSIQICGDLLSANDQDSYNDCISRSDEGAYTFEIAHEIQVQTSRIIIPNSDKNLISGRTTTPRAEFKNVGIGDASDVPAKMIVKKLPDNNVVFEDNIIVMDIQSGKYNTKTVDFSQMTLKDAGEYEVCVIISSEEDIVRDDDTLCTTFTVESGLQGVYTVGKKFSGNSRNFPTIDSVMNALYYLGISGSIVFELTDAEYNLTSPTQYSPALDFTTKIVGLGYNLETQKYNSITFRPHRERAAIKGGVNINLQTGNGRGIQFGQSFMPENEYALFHKYGSTENANFPGYVIFDGGSQKAFQFNLYSFSGVFGSVFYLGSGSHNITVTNCIIDNKTETIENKVRIPLVTYDPTNGYNFQADTTTGSRTDGYSAGIVNRATLVRFEDANFIKFDTLTNSNNTFTNNEISGFGYGIVSLGLGSLYKESDAIYERYYNTGNRISGNTIHDIAKAGIFLGHEENSTIGNNRIYDIGSYHNEAAGIMAGGFSRNGFPGYSNVELRIDGNEISNVHSRFMASGIRVEQVLNTFQSPAGGEVRFPDIPENMSVINNMVWGITADEADAFVAGIHLLTERDAEQEDQWSKIITPESESYKTRNDKIANNTIIMNDASGMMNSGPVCGIAIQNTSNASLVNNAIAIDDNSIDTRNEAAAAVFYQGEKPNDGGLNSDRNAYWPGNSGEIFRFIELDEDNNIIEMGHRNEFESLNQWQLWTGSDDNSVSGDFTKDLLYNGSNPMSLRIKTVPETPLGSILDNRGERLDYVSTDLDGNNRGVAGQRYDIGACEFIGQMFVSDVEMVSLYAPGAYKSGSGTFNDAEYIMTTSPVEVKARIRNNGSLQQSGVEIEAKIYRELPNGTYGETPEVEATIKADIETTESSDIFFRLADKQNEEFEPKTYSELTNENYNVPAQFSTMQENVTPKYKITISIESDQNNENNIMSKEVRFFIMKSQLRFLVSSENSFVDLYYGKTPTPDQIAGKLNSDSLLAGMKRLGWYTDADEGRYDIDLFDRNGWEPKSVNYTMYKSMFWTDGDDKALTRYEKMDIEDFLNIGNDQTKKNLVIGSQEMVRRNSMDEDYDVDFLHNILRAEHSAPGNPLGDRVSNDGNSVEGVLIGRGLVEDIENTTYKGDMEAMCGLMTVYEEGEGLAQVAYEYVEHEASDNATMGVAMTSLVKNTINLGVDWRHWSNMERLLRSILDYLDKNGGDVVPIELAEFNANAVSNRVDLSWATASELNSSRFEIEKAEMNEAGRSAFVKINEMAAAGKSNSRRDYGPVSDYDVEYGNSYVYRLKLVDNDGNYKYSDEKVVTLEGLNGGINIGEAIPNPAVDKVKLDLQKGKDVNIEFKLYDMSGKLIDTEIVVGSSSVEVDLRNISNGSYTLVLKSGDIVITKQIRVVK